MESPNTGDLFEPHMPEVDVLPDMPAFFAGLRPRLVDETGRRHMGIVTPGRLLMLVPVPPPSPDLDQGAAGNHRLLATDQPLDISAISYTNVPLLTQELTPRCIPFFGNLLSLAYSGHSVIVFEGHPSALEAGVRGSSVLIVDSGMIPFLQQDWAAVAFRALRADAKIFIHDRQRFSLGPIARSKEPPGWAYSEQDGEISYLNCLLTTLAQGPLAAVKVTSRSPLPDLAELARPDDLDWVSGLPFRYDQLNADEVIQHLLRLAGWGKYHFFKTQGTFKAALAQSKTPPRPVSFRVVTGKAGDGRKEVTITKL